MVLEAKKKKVVGPEQPQVVAVKQDMVRKFPKTQLPSFVCEKSRKKCPGVPLHYAKIIVTVTVSTNNNIDNDDKNSSLGL